MTYFVRPAGPGYQVSQLTDAKEPENDEDTILDNGVSGDREFEWG